VHQVRGEHAEAIEWFHVAGDLDPACGARLDEGDLCIERGLFERASQAYGAAAPGSRDWEWAHPSSLFARAFGLGDEAAARELSQLADAGSERAVALRVHLEPYLHALAPPDSSIVNSARATRPGTRLRSLACTSLEPPSAIFAARWTVRRGGVDDGFPISFTSIPSPDPRVGAAADPVWRYDADGRAWPTAPPPSEEVRAQLAALAARRYRLDDWAAAARALPASLPAAELRAATVHPGDPPDGVDPARWLFRWQLAAALALAWRDDGVRELAPLLDGPTDWVGAAATIALTGVARADRARCSAALQAIEPRLAPPTGPIYYGCRFLPALRCLLLMDLSASVRRSFEELRREHDPFGG
jgi:hypothetical protein